MTWRKQYKKALRIRRLKKAIEQWKNWHDIAVKSVGGLVSQTFKPNDFSSQLSLKDWHNLQMANLRAQQQYVPLGSLTSQDSLFGKPIV